MTDLIVSGTVYACTSKPRGCGGRITILEMIADNNAHFHASIPGSHRLNLGEKVTVEYQCHTGVNWVSRYEIPSTNFACEVGNE